jgi:hypothetical protein
MSNANTDRRRSDPSATDPKEEYKVGPGRPPREHQFQPGRSGNPKGAKRKQPSIRPDLKKALEQALDQTITLKQGEKEQIMTMAEAGMKQLVAQYAKGDHRARRDLFALAEKFKVNLFQTQNAERDDEISPTHQKILEAFCARWSDRAAEPERAFAPPELLDDDVKE